MTKDRAEERRAISMAKTAAFFDIDGTISREGLISEMFKKMIKYELIDPSKWYEDVEPAFTRWDKRVGNYDDYLQKMVDIYSETVQNTNSFHILYIAKRVIEQKGERVYTYTRDRIRWHREHGYRVIAISGSPVELVREMSEKYGMDDYRGTVYKVGPDGRYSGEIIPMWDSESKQCAVLQMAKQYGIDLSESYAYGDTNGDFAMMKLVGHPVAVNPTRELLAHIQKDDDLRKKIVVIVERKDVIYRLNTETLELAD
jgi:HAD superfamily hydrolase (TIGR01490 family)